MAAELDVDLELFGSLFVFMQKLTRFVDEQLADYGITSRQWLLLAVVDNAFSGHAPTITEAAAVYGSSRQNVKQIALQLERRGWLRLEPDPADARVVRLAPAEKMAVFHDPAVQAHQASLVQAVFAGLDAPEHRTLRDLIARCIDELPSSPTVDGTPSRREELP
jgi:DNA-binding MarR family transcriptional regulator